MRPFLYDPCPAAVRWLALGLLLGLAPAAAAKDLLIGYLELRNDPRYRQEHTYAQFLTQPWGRPYAGAETALGESRFVGSALGVDFKLERVRARNRDDLAPALDGLLERGARFIILDLPGDLTAAAAAAAGDRELLLFNISALDDGLRQEQCRSRLLHVIPNHAMLTDALAQYLVFRKWREVLMLVGPQPQDGQLAESFQRSARRFGLKIVDRRPFILSNDPRQRESNNVALLTGGADYDVVFVADTDGEFARAVPYQTLHPRPVVGSDGLAGLAWHWSWERHGAPQLNGRFEKQAGRRMTGFDWAAWMAVKAVVEAAVRTRGGEFPVLRDYLLGEEIILDGFKGHRVNFRPWDRQLRQPVLLASHNWVVERAPIRGFLHQTNNLDTLGFDERDSRCRF